GRVEGEGGIGGRDAVAGRAGGWRILSRPAHLTVYLSATRRMDRPVLDQTSLKGRYDFTVDLSGLGFAGREPGTPGGPSIFAAVKRDLGLRLEARKEPIEILGIDSVNKAPVEN